MGFNRAVSRRVGKMLEGRAGEEEGGEVEVDWEDED